MFVVLSVNCLKAWTNNNGEHCILRYIYAPAFVFELCQLDRFRVVPSRICIGVGSWIRLGEPSGQVMKYFSKMNEYIEVQHHTVHESKEKVFPNY